MVENLSWSLRVYPLKLFYLQIFRYFAISLHNWGRNMGGKMECFNMDINLLSEDYFV